MLDTIQKHVESFMRSQQKKLALRQLRKRLLEIKASAAEYEKAKLPAGHDYYGVLYANALAAIEKYCTDWNETVQELKLSAPFLYALEKKANPGNAQAEKTVTFGRVVAGIVTLALLCAGAGAAFGLGNGIFHRVASWIG